MAIEGITFTIAGTSDYPVCECCGKTNLTRAVMVRNECGEEFNVGCICASPDGHPNSPAYGHLKLPHLN